MAKLVDPRELPDAKVHIPGLKPAVREFAPSEESDPVIRIEKENLHFNFAPDADFYCEVLESSD